MKRAIDTIARVQPGRLREAEDIRGGLPSL